jgi:hypothetical protein
MIYGLYRREALLKTATAVFREDLIDSDNDVVLGLLAQGTISSCPEAVLYKRLKLSELPVTGLGVNARLKNAVAHQMSLRRQKKRLKTSLLARIND